MADYRVNVKIELPDNLGTVTLQGTSDAAAEAENEAKAVAALMVGTTIAASHTDPYAAPAGTFPSAAPATFRDATFKFYRSSDKKRGSKTIRCVTSDVAGTEEGTIDITNALVTALATAYRDGSGAGGYDVVDAYYVN